MIPAFAVSGPLRGGQMITGHRRKTLRVCAKPGRGRLAKITDRPVIFESCSIDPAGRPDQLAPQDYVAMANLCAKALA